MASKVIQPIKFFISAALSIPLMTGCVMTDTQGVLHLPKANIDYLSPAEVSQKLHIPGIRLKAILNSDDVAYYTLSYGTMSAPGECYGTNPFESGVYQALLRIVGERIDVAHKRLIDNRLQKGWQDIIVNNRRYIVTEDGTMALAPVHKKKLGQIAVADEIDASANNVVIFANNCEPVTVNAERGISGGLELSAWGLRITIPMSHDKEVLKYDNCLTTSLFNPIDLVMPGMTTTVCTFVLQAESGSVIGFNFTDGKTSSGFNVDFGFSGKISKNQLNSAIAQMTVMSLLSESIGAPIGIWFDDKDAGPGDWYQLQSAVRNHEFATTTQKIMLVQRMLSLILGKHVKMDGKLGEQTYAAAREYIRKSRFRTKILDDNALTITSKSFLFCMMRDYWNIDPPEESIHHGI